MEPHKTRPRLWLEGADQQGRHEVVRRHAFHKNAAQYAWYHMTKQEVIPAKLLDSVGMAKVIGQQK